jgi:CubicO group peptidase (beta-lactamase class C family)
VRLRRQVALCQGVSPPGRDKSGGLAPTLMPSPASRMRPQSNCFKRRVRRNLPGDLSRRPSTHEAWCWGRGFGLGMAVRTAVGHNREPAPVGTFYWTGSWGTTFWKADCR